MPQRRSAYADRLREFSDFTFGDDALFKHAGGWRAFFRNRIGAAFDGRVVLEIGCSDGAFLSRIATRHPHIAFVGLDWKPKMLHAAAGQVAALGLPNVALLHGRAQDVARIFAAGELDEIWLFHPDPCDKPAELKHRLVAEPFLADVHKVLRPGASLVLKTDHPGYYQWVLALFGLPEPESLRANPRVKVRELAHRDQLPAWSDLAARWFDVSMNTPDFWKDRAAQSHTAASAFAGERTAFEHRFAGKGRPIYAVELTNRSDATPRDRC